MRGRIFTLLSALSLLLCIGAGVLWPRRIMPIRWAIVYWWAADLLKVLTPVLIGTLLAYVALRQWRTNHHKLKLDLFDRRFKIYQATRIFLTAVTSSEKPEIEDIRQFHQEIEAADFLVPEPLGAFLKTLIKNAYALRKNTRDMRNFDRPPAAAAHELLVVEDRRLCEFFADADKALVERFDAVLKLRHIK